MASFFSLIIILIPAYALGSIPFGLLLARYYCGLDPRTAGSGNVGATNVSRLCGKKVGALTLLFDALKGFLPVYLLLYSSSGLAYAALPVGLAIICGHMFSIFLAFKGGKGVATTVGVFLAYAPLALVIAGLACLAVIWHTKFVSAGSLVLAAILSLYFLFTGTWAEFFLVLIISALIITAHRENIRRLLNGEEKPWYENRG